MFIVIGLDLFIGNSCFGCFHGRLEDVVLIADVEVAEVNLFWITETGIEVIGLKGKGILLGILMLLVEYP